MPELQLEALPFDEAIEFWRAKEILPPEEFYALAAEARAKAFTVSGVARMDMIEDVHAALGAALEQGITLRDFKKMIPDVIETAGWPGYRTDTIFQTNIQGAYNNGRYAQQTDPDVLARRPWWQFLHTPGQANPRLHHEAHDHEVYRADDPFWDVWYPHKGSLNDWFRCKCKVRTLSNSELEEFGITPQEPTGPPRDIEALGKKKWQPDLGKYRPELKEKLAPPQIRTRADIEQAVRDKLSPLFKRGFNGIEYHAYTRAYMKTNSAGTIIVSNRTIFPSFRANKELLDGFKALSQGTAPTFNQEVALEAFWHEIGHNMQELGGYGCSTAENRLMETINQWVSRWTYPEMVERMGYDATLLTKHKEVIRGAYGYDSYVGNFRALVSELGIGEEEVLETIRKIHRETSRYSYERPLVELLAQKSGVAQDKVRELLRGIWRQGGDFRQILSKALQ